MGFTDPSNHVMFMVSPGWYNFAIQPPNESPYNWCYSGLVPRRRAGGSAHLINHPWFHMAVKDLEQNTTTAWGGKNQWQCWPGWRLRNLRHRVIQFFKWWPLMGNMKWGWCALVKPWSVAFLQEQAENRNLCRTDITFKLCWSSMWKYTVGCLLLSQFSAFLNYYEW